MTMPVSPAPVSNAPASLEPSTDFEPCVDLNPCVDLKPFADGPPAAAWIPTAELVSRQASQTPHAVAVTDGARELTYAELDVQANQLAHYLAAQGVGPESLVGVCLYRGIDLAVALLAVWRAGAAYLPLTPDLPARRIGRLLEGTEAELVLTETESAGAVQAAGSRAVILDTIADQLAELPAHAPAHAADSSPVQPHNAACVIHTSGSTGEPNAVMLTHAGMANRIDWAVRTWALGPRDRVLQKTAITFDAHCWEVFAPLTCGATLVMAEPGSERDPAGMLRQAAAQGATVLQVVPSLLKQLADTGGFAACGSLRLLISAGEPLYYELVQQVLEQVDVEFWNTYGPTECSIDVTAHRVDPAIPAGAVPIGRPLQGVRLVVVDEDDKPVPAGEPGELLAGGVAVGRGYYRNPELTDRRFVPDPFAADGSRLYRTGDRVRWNEDGELEFLCRLDAQVKVDGVRIEPAEIESVLIEHPAVADVLVTAFQARDGFRRLAAFVVPQHGARLVDLRPYLAKLLPASHIPSTFIEVTQLPDAPARRPAVRKPGAQPALSPDGRPARRIPLTPLELLVADAWERVLGVADVGLDDDFFHRDGSSLQLTLLAAQLRESAGVAFEPGALFKATTVEAQAELLAGLGATGA